MKTPRWFYRWEGACIVGQHDAGNGWVVLHVALPIGGGWMQRAYETRAAGGAWHMVQEW